jgi:hypothetical protein
MGTYDAIKGVDMFRTGTIEAERLIPLGFGVSAAERSLPETAAIELLPRSLALALARWRD